MTIYITSAKSDSPFKKVFLQSRRFIGISLTAAAVGSSSPVVVSNAFGPTEVGLTITRFVVVYCLLLVVVTLSMYQYNDYNAIISSYKPVDLCNGQKPIMPGQKAAEGLFPVCIEVEANVNNPDKEKTLKDVSVYGFVKENGAGNSVLPNNPDFKSDSGQYGNNIIINYL